MNQTLALSFSIAAPTEPLIITNLSNDCSVFGDLLSFTRNDKLTFIIRAIQPAEGDVAISVTSLALMAVHQKKKCARHLSPFDPFDAVTVIKSWGIPTIKLHGENNTANGVLSTDIAALHPLTVTAPKGHWLLNGSLSILIRTKIKTRARQYPVTLDLRVKS